MSSSSKDLSNGASGSENAEGGELSEAELAKVWKDLMKGEKTANILESNLTSLEKKIDDLLASFEDSERSLLPQDSSSAKKDDEGEKEKKEVDESKVEEQSNMDGNGELNSEGSKETSK